MAEKSPPPKVKYSRVMIELDCLFDMRLATLARMGDEALINAIKSGYYDRLSDNFEGVDYDTFKSIYDNRDKTLLKDAVITKISKFLKEFVLGTFSNTNNGPFHMTPSILVNCYPYKLMDEEVAMIIAGVKQITAGLCDIECVSISPQQLTPLYVKVNLTTLIIYEYDKWLEIHALTGDWRKHTAPEVTLLAPRISMLKGIKDSSIKDDAFVMIEKQCAPFINLKLLPSEHFSLILTPEHFERARKSLNEEKTA